MQQHQSSGGGEPGPGRSNLARYRSAPATWLEALIEEEDEDPLKQNNQSLTQLLASNSTTPATRDNLDSGVGDSAGFFDAGTSAASSSGFARQNSSPAEFLDGYFSNYGASLDYMAAGNLDVGDMVSGKRIRDTTQLSPLGRYPSQLKVEQNAHLPDRISSLPESDMDRLLEESVPFRVRAKRGCATHPRSIAERVRRTKISDRIRKLQELVPNMDKQTNTSDMLDEAVEYVKYLQKQIQELNEQQKKCKCAINN